VITVLSISILDTAGTLSIQATESHQFGANHGLKSDHLAFSYQDGQNKLIADMAY